MTLVKTVVARPSDGEGDDESPEEKPKVCALIDFCIFFYCFFSNHHLFFFDILSTRADIPS